MGATTRSVMTEVEARQNEILGPAFSPNMTNLLALDAEGDRIGLRISWPDGRAGDESRRLMRRPGGRKVLAAFAGTAMTGKDVLPRMAWLRRDSQRSARAAARIDAGFSLPLRATGRLVAEWSVVSGGGQLSV